MQSFHERFDREEVVKASSNRSFGMVFAIVFACLGGWKLWHGHSLASITLLAVAGVFAAAAWCMPSLLAPLNRGWLKLGLLLFRIISPLTVGLFYLTTIVPIGLMMRLLHKDLLRLKVDPAAASYWIERNPRGPSPESMKRQF